MTTREWQKSHPEAMRAIRKRWYEKNRDHVREYQREYKRQYRKRKSIEALKKGEDTNGNLRTDSEGE